MASSLAINTTDSSPVPAGNVMSQISAGPEGLLYTLANQIMAIINQLQSVYNSITQEETTVQSKLIQTSADSQRQAASQQALATACEAVGGLATAGVTFFTMYKDNQSNKVEGPKLDAANAELDKLKAFQEKIQPIASKTPTSEWEEVDKTKAMDEVKSPAASRKAEMLRGDYDLTKPNSKEAIESMTSQERARFDQGLQDKISDQVKNVNTIQTRISASQTSNNLLSQAAQGAFTLLTKGGQAIFTSNAGQATAAQQISSGVAQMSGGTADSARQQLAGYGNKAESLIQTAKAGSVRAQT